MVPITIVFMGFINQSNITGGAPPSSDNLMVDIPKQWNIYHDINTYNPNYIPWFMVYGRYKFQIPIIYHG